MVDGTHDFEDLFRLEDMDDDELRDLIVQALEEYPDIDAEGVDVLVEDGFVTLTGRVGVEEELQEIEHILTDVIGVTEYSNEIVVDELVRMGFSEAADEAVAEAAEAEAFLGGGTDLTDPEADHLIEDVAADLYGTHDIQQAISRGTAYEPPDRPIQEGTWSEEDH
ncbi:MAG TPA: BON domain-containing protein [Longimicrobiales bacterium]|nr:BON domain-containing protein [Longimicrobiales bacterium]